jgi:hypothetical protein
VSSRPARHLRDAADPAPESQLLRQQLGRVEAAFYDDRTRPTDLKALSVEMRELRALIKAAEVVERKTLTVVSDTADEPLS